MELSAGHRLRLPGRPAGAAQVLARRVAAAVALILIVMVLVLLDRDGYGDIVDGTVGFVDALYYATVAVTTTGYGDIAPVTSQARTVTALVVTPLRVGFLILVVGTTVEVLTDRWREGIRRERWRDRMHDHIIICGFGTKGRAAAEALVGRGHPVDGIVVVEEKEHVATQAQAEGYAVVVGDATRSAVLAEAAVRRARGVIVALDRDDTAVLVTLTARDLNPDVAITASAKEEENTRLLTRSGADTVVTADEATGSLLGTAITHPAHVALIEDLLRPGEGIDLVEEPFDGSGGGLTLGVVRDGVVVPLAGAGADAQPRQGERVVRVRAVAKGGGR